VEAHATGRAIEPVDEPVDAQSALPGAPEREGAVLAAGKISVTPIALDLTNHTLLEELARWDRGWSAPLEVSAD